MIRNYEKPFRFRSLNNSVIDYTYRMYVSIILERINLYLWQLFAGITGIIEFQHDVLQCFDRTKVNFYDLVQCVYIFIIQLCVLVY